MATTARVRKRMKPSPAPGVARHKVVYLLGAGATHASVRALGGTRNLLMQGLWPLIRPRVSAAVSENPELASMTDLANDVVTEEADLEQLTTFLGDAPSRPHRMFAEELRRIFMTVLKDECQKVESELGGKPLGLYKVLLDLHTEPTLREDVTAILTLNYDDYIEEAYREVHGSIPHLGINSFTNSHVGGLPPILKLHGSLGWTDSLPIDVGAPDGVLWIPPGVSKAKGHYPFNLLWGMARELLDCDVLRIIGCRLSSNDWDLVSLLFSASLVRRPRRRFVTEVIGSHHDAVRIRRDFPYLNVRSVFELPGVGEDLIGEVLGSEPQSFAQLAEIQQKTLEASGLNWFQQWLLLFAERTAIAAGGLRTKHGLVTQFISER